MMGSGDAGFVMLNDGETTYLGLAPQNEVVEDILDAKGGDAFHVESTCYLKNLEEATITFALFKTGEFDLDQIQGGA